MWMTYRTISIVKYIVRRERDYGVEWIKPLSTLEMCVHHSQLVSLEEKKEKSNSLKPGIAG